MSAPPLISVQGVSVAYAEKTVLREIHLDVPPGDFLGILGPNGSGKTTLLRTMSRALSPTQGHLLLEGQDLRRYSFNALARALAVVPQVSSPSLDFTAGELVLMGRFPFQGRWGGETRKDREVAEEAMRLTNTLPFVDRLTGTLSGGEFQRVLVARALAQEPRILLLDEPTAHLDLSAQIHLLELLHRLNRETGMTLVAVLHDLNLAATYCRRLALLSEGHLVALGTPEDVLKPDRLREVYGVEVLVRSHPLTGRPMVLPMPGTEAAFPDGARPRIHVVCGGGTGAFLLRALSARGFPLTAGALNGGDTDAEAAKELQIPFAEAPPFSPLTPESLEQAGEMMRGAECILLTDTPFGPGNLANLGVIRNAQATGKRVLMMRTAAGSEGDFTGGQATALLQELEHSGAVALSNPAEVLAALLPSL